jgi:hypothetical protein
MLFATQSITLQCWVNDEAFGPTYQPPKAFTFKRSFILRTHTQHTTDAFIDKYTLLKIKNRLIATIVTDRGLPLPRLISTSSP